MISLFVGTTEKHNFHEFDKVYRGTNQLWDG
jgi:hypothetical protein